MSVIRCGKCNCWLGEAATALVPVECLEKGDRTEVPKPRDLRLCKRCGSLNVLVPRDSVKLVA